MNDVHISVENNRHYHQSGETGTKYYFREGDEKSFKISYKLAIRQYYARLKQLKVKEQWKSPKFII